MSWRRLWVVARDEGLLTLRRPMIWTLIILLLLVTWGVSNGVVQIVVGSGDATVGGKKAFLTSEFAITQMLAIFPFLLYSFFVAAAAGLSVIRDEEGRVLELLQSTPLRPGEYAWGKFLGVVGAFLAVLAIHVVFLVLFLAVLPNADMLETRGPFALGNYLRPALLFAIPTIVFMAGIAFGMGTGFRRAILVFALPISLLILCATFLWSWSPAWLAEPVNRALMFADMGGVRWLRETWLEVDRGAQFYNTQPVRYGALILGNRFLWLTIGLGSAALGVRRFVRTARAAHAIAPDQIARALAPSGAPASPVAG